MKINSKNFTKIALSVLVLAGSITATQVFAVDPVLGNNGTLSERLGQFIGMEVSHRDLESKRDAVRQSNQGATELNSDLNLVKANIGIATNTNTDTGGDTALPSTDIISSSIELSPVDHFVGIQNQSSDIFGIETPVDFRLYGKASLQALNVQQKAALQKLSVGYLSQNRALTNPNTLSVDGAIKIAALADANRTGLERVCANDFGKLELCGEDSVVAGPVDETYTWVENGWSGCSDTPTSGTGGGSCVGTYQQTTKKSPESGDDPFDWVANAFYFGEGGFTGQEGDDTLNLMCQNSNLFYQVEGLEATTNSARANQKWTVWQGNTDGGGDCFPLSHPENYAGGDPRNFNFEEWNTDSSNAWVVATNDITGLPSTSPCVGGTRNACLANNGFEGDACRWVEGGGSSSGSSTETQIVSCQDSAGNIVDVALCNPDEKPATTRSCEASDSDNVLTAVARGVCNGSFRNTTCSIPIQLTSCPNNSNNCTTVDHISGLTEVQCNAQAANYTNNPGYRVNGAHTFNPGPQNGALVQCSSSLPETSLSCTDQSSNCSWTDGREYEFTFGDWGTCNPSTSTQIRPMTSCTSISSDGTRNTPYELVGGPADQTCTIPFSWTDLEYPSRAC